jgi:hypothetical protein
MDLRRQLELYVEECCTKGASTEGKYLHLVEPKVKGYQLGVNCAKPILDRNSASEERLGSFRRSVDALGKREVECATENIQDLIQSIEGEKAIFSRHFPRADVPRIYS